MEKTLFEQIKEVLNIDNRVAEIVTDSEKSFLQNAKAGYNHLCFNIGEHIENEDMYDLYEERAKDLFQKKGYKIHPPIDNDGYIDFIIKTS
jgi:hypothetical protein